MLTRDHLLRDKFAMRKEIFEKFFKIFEWLLTFGLLFLTFVFIKDVWIKFKSCSTSFSQSTKPLNFMKNLTTVICFDPALKPSVLNDFNTTMVEVQSTFQNPPNISMPWSEFYEKAAYKIAQDYTIAFSLDDDLEHELVINGTEKSEYSDLISWEEIYTLWSGICFKMTMKSEIHQNMKISMHINFKNNLKIEDIPKVEIYLTSEPNPYGIIDLEWSQGDEFGIEVNPNSKLYYYADLKIQQTVKLKNCVDSQSTISCSTKT